MADVSKTIELNAALSPDFQTAFKAAESQSKELAKDLKALELQESEYIKLQELGLKKSQAVTKENAKEVEKAAKDYDELAKKLGMTGKGANDIAEHLKKLGSQKKDIQELKKTLDAKAEINKTAQSLKKLQSVYDKTKDPKLLEHINKYKSRLNELGVVAGDEKKGTTGKLSAIKNNIKSLGTGFIASVPIIGKLSSVFGALSPKIIAATVAFVGLTKGVFDARKKLNEYALETIKTGDEIAKEAHALGMSGESFQELSYAMRRGGASSEGFAKAIKTIDTQMDEARNGNKTSIELFKKFGVTLSDVKNKNPEEIFMQLADGIAQIEDPINRAKAGAALFGKEGYRLTAAMSIGSKELYNLRQEARKTGNVLSEYFLTVAEHGADELENISMHTEGFKKQLGVAVTQSKIKLFETLNREFGRNQKAIKYLSVAATGLAKVFDGALSLSIKAVSGLIRGIVWTGESLGDLIYNLVNKHIPNLWENIKSFWGSAKEFGADVLTKVKGFFSSIGEFFTNIWNGLVNRFDASIDYIKSKINVLIGYYNKANDYLGKVPLVGEKLKRDKIEEFELSQAEKALNKTLVGNEQTSGNIGGNRQINIYNNINAQGAGVGVGADIQRAIGNGNAQAALEILQKGLAENYNITYSSAH